MAVLLGRSAHVPRPADLHREHGLREGQKLASRTGLVFRQPARPRGAIW